jgi:hypothetical protein
MALVGKGPSVDLLTAEDLCRQPVMGLNEVMRDVGCQYGVYLDNRQKQLEIPWWVVVFAPQDCYTGRGYAFARHEFRPRESILFSTAATAILLLGHWGVKHLILMGFDAWDTDTGKIKADRITPIAKRGSANYSDINTAIAAALRQTQITVTWFHREEERQRWRSIYGREVDTGQGATTQT